VHSGVARIEARSGRLVEVVTLPFTPGPVAGVSLALDSSRIRAGESALAVASVFDTFGNPVPGETVAFESTVGRVEHEEVRTDATGRARTAVRGTTFGQGIVRASAGARSDTRALWVVPSSAYIPMATRP
jgi:hypothetical protein